MNKITIHRTEQWEYTACGYGLQATGSCEMSAELNLLRKIIDKMENEKKSMAYNLYDERRW